MIKKIIAFFLTGFWISLSEFIRNELLFKTYWIEKYESLGLTFPSTTLNNAIWGIWSFLLAGLILYVSRKMKSLETIIITWLFTFVLMWLVIGNLNVLPFKLLIFALPLSILEVTVGTIICNKVLNTK